MQCTLGCYTIGLSDEKLRERFATRRGMVSVEVLPAQFLEEAYRLREPSEGWRSTGAAGPGADLVAQDLC